MTDLFHENSPPEWREYWLGLMAMTPWNFYYCLTKRPELMLDAVELQNFAIGGHRILRTLRHLNDRSFSTGFSGYLGR